MLPTLLSHPDPTVRYKTRVLALRQDPNLSDNRQLQEEIRCCERVTRLLSDRDKRGEIPFHPYTKWQGAHWVLTVLADTGYPPGDPALLPLRDQVYAWLFSREHIDSIHERSKNHRQVRLHASMEANALFASLVLGLVDERTLGLVERLLWAQWDDGGWNCDKHKEAHNSSFYESITPLRALACYSRETCEPAELRSEAAEAAARCAEIFLNRRLYRRLSDNRVIRTSFLSLKTPCYWHYDILFGLKVMAEAGFINDPRCQDALDVLESKRLPGGEPSLERSSATAARRGGFAAEGKYYTVYTEPGKVLHHGSRVDWGPSGRKQPNPFVTIDALFVLRAAGRS